MMTDLIATMIKILYFKESAQQEQMESVQTPHVAGKNCYYHYFFDEHSKTISVYSGQKRLKRSTCDCSGCLRKDCGSCKFCHLDKPKLGGPGKKKKRCICYNISTGIIIL